MSHKAKIYTIPYHVPFLSELVTFMIKTYGTGIDLSSTKILLPSRRAVRAIQAEFLLQAKDKSIIPPRFMPIGDVDDEDLDLSLLSLTGGLSSVLDLPPVISSIDRRYILAQLISQKDKGFSWAQCLDFAKSLARLMDQVYTENLNLSDLPDLVPTNELSDHWKEIVQFLDILSEQWPKILQERGVIDGADRRNRLMNALSDFWSNYPPESPILIAGSTGSIPAVTQLMKVISHLPQGGVILPGLDLNMPDAVWSDLPMSHPQSIMKNTLNFIGAERADVVLLNHKKIDRVIDTAISESLYPSSHFLINSTSIAEKDFSHIHLIETENEREEALSIALILRRMMNDPHKTAIVITPDRNLARRISSELKRWNIEVNDSAGQGLHTQPIAVFLRKFMALFVDKISVSTFLSFLKTPDLKGHLSQKELFEFETKFHRSSTFVPDELTLNDILLLQDKYPFLQKFIKLFEQIDSIKTEQKTISEFLTDILNALHQFMPDQISLWDGDDGQTMINYFQTLQASDVAHRSVSIHEFRDLIEHFWSETVVRSTRPSHPNITILGQIEARLLHADVTILAGLNESIWPQDPTPDPWMSQFMRRQFGLPPAERQYALSAHDFVGGLSSNEVYLTRSEKLNGAPTVPARWIQRILAYIESQNLSKDHLSYQNKMVIRPIIENLSHVETIKRISAPMPIPPLHKRPRSFYVTDIEALIKNPYALYIKSILRLRPLRTIDDENFHLQIGNVLHEIFEKYIVSLKSNPTQNDYDVLMSVKSEICERYRQSTQSSFWSLFETRLNSWLPSFLTLDRQWREDTKPYLVEHRSSCKLALGQHEIQLNAKADRIDFWGERGIAILDYKTGKAPSNPELINGKKPQLPLEMVMAAEGAFGQKIDPSHIRAEFWHVPHQVGFERKPADEIKISKDNILSAAEVIDYTLGQLTELMTSVLNPATPFFVIPPSGWMMNDDEEKIHHLARTDEWAFLYDQANSDDDSSGAAA